MTDVPLKEFMDRASEYQGHQFCLQLRVTGPDPTTPVVTIPVTIFVTIRESGMQDRGGQDEMVGRVQLDGDVRNELYIDAKQVEGLSVDGDSAAILLPGGVVVAMNHYSSTPVVPLA